MSAIRIRRENQFLSSHKKSYFILSEIEFFNFYENYFSFGSDFASRHHKSLKNSLKWSSTSNQLESEFFSKNIYIFWKYWYFENLNFFILELVFFKTNSRIRDNYLILRPEMNSPEQEYHFELLFTDFWQRILSLHPTIVFFVVIFSRLQNIPLQNLHICARVPRVKRHARA